MTNAKVRQPLLDLVKQVAMSQGDMGHEDQSDPRSDEVAEVWCRR